MASSSRVTVCDVALDPRKGGTEAVWTYRWIAGLGLGDAVVAPLGTRTELGYVLRIYEATEESLGFPLKSLRKVSGKVDGLALPPSLVQLVLFTAREYLCPEALALAPAIPPGVRDRLTSEWRIVDYGLSRAEKNPVLQEVLRVMEEGSGIYKGGRASRDSLRTEAPRSEPVKERPPPSELFGDELFGDELFGTEMGVEEDQGGKRRGVSPVVTKALKALEKKGTVEKRLRVAKPQDRSRADALYRLTPNREAIDRFLLNEGKKKPAQAVTLITLQSSDRGALSLAEIKMLASVTEATVKALVQSGLIEHEEGGGLVPTRPAPEPNPAQRVAIEAIGEAVRSREFQSFLLFGVTGSGKTEVYLRASTEALRTGRTVLYVVPEIALAAQAIGQLRERFGAGVAILHSNLNPTERLNNWLKVSEGSVKVVLGARSALFAPIANLGLIVLDEEHEQAYKQESSPRYHAKRVALELARLHRCPLVLGSATPSVETFYEAERQEMAPPDAPSVGPILLTLPERTANSQLPEVFVKDLAEGYRNKHPSVLSADLSEAIAETLKEGRQTILFLNRRGYAPFVLCRDCGQSLQCPNCSVSLSYHRNENRLRCHHCGYSARPPEFCPHCGKSRISPFGAGTEKVEEALHQDFPDAAIRRLDRDAVRQKGALEQILAGFRAGEIQILVGTQMVAKGLDFPNVTLVGVIAADMSLNIPDFRASERTYQLLSQVSGRAGRGEAAGRVIVQTFNPDHPAIVAARTHDYLPFYELIKSERLEVGYPPFKRLVNVLVSGEDYEAVFSATAEAAIRIGERCPEAEVLGPVECAVERVYGKWRRHVLVKLEAGASAEPVARALSGFDPADVLVVLDVDPYTLM